MANPSQDKSNPPEENRSHASNSRTRRGILGLGAAILLGLGYGTYRSTSEYLASARVHSHTGTHPTDVRYLTGQPRLADGEGTVWATVLNAPSEVDERIDWNVVPDGIEQSLTLEGDSTFLVPIVAVLPIDEDVSLGRARVDGDTVRYRAEREGGTTDSESQPAELGFHYKFEAFEMTYPYPEPTNAVANWQAEE